MAGPRHLDNPGAGRRERLDRLLVSRGLVKSRARAQDLIRQGHVLVAGRIAGKSAQLVPDDADIRLGEEAWQHVSRGALKLRAGLAHFGFSVSGRVALDVGASTGGFTETLLGHGAVRVYAVDIGTAQLHETLRRDPRVINLEGQDARRLSATDVPEPIGAIVADLSFISLAKALPAALELAAADAWLIALVKPQFEAGPEAVGRGGIVRDHPTRERALAEVRQWIDALPKWQTAGHIASPIKGRTGNLEYLIGADRRA